MQNKELFIDKLKELISYKTVYCKGEKNAPFGEQLKNALNFFLSTAKEFGLETKNYDNYMGEVCLGGGKEIGIIGHLDVVPEGNGWVTPPYVLTEKDGKLYGRGVLDDKLPLLINLFVLKELKESGEKINKKFRLFVGCNEETGWKDAEYFEKNYGFPEYGFSPDGDFPVSYAEKGMAIFSVKLPSPKNFTGVTGGTVINAVCNYASAVSKIPVNYSLIKKYGLKVTGNKIESFGKSAHGSHPELGKNAIKPLLEYMTDCGENYLSALEYLFNDKGKISEITSEQGSVTLSCDLISQDESGIMVKCDCRFPYPVKIEEIKERLNKSNLNYTCSVKHETRFVDKNDGFVKTLINAYNSVTKENDLPISQCGSTFARVFKKGVAFGPEFPNKPSTIHEPNECVDLLDVEKMYEIYKKAIFDLAKTDF